MLAGGRPKNNSLSQALAGKNIQEPRSATRLSSVGVLERSFMTIVQYWRPLQIHLYSTHLRQWRPTWSPLLELLYMTLLRYYLIKAYTNDIRFICQYQSSTILFVCDLLCVDLTHSSNASHMINDICHCQRLRICTKHAY